MFKSYSSLDYFAMFLVAIVLTLAIYGVSVN